MIGPITLAMVKQHSTLNKLLSKYEKAPTKNVDKARSYFKKFKWNMEKHFFIEEKNLFSVIDASNNEEMVMTQVLIAEHQQMINITNKMIKDLDKSIRTSAYELKEIIFDHERREVLFLYPKLDERLDKNQKKEILRKTKEIKIM